MIDRNQDREAFAWQTGIWNRISDIYLREIDRRFVPVVEALIGRATLERFAGPPVPGVAPGVLGESSSFLRQLDAAEIQARVETETLGFEFPVFTSAWDTLGGVTTAQMPPEHQQESMDAVMAAMYWQGDGPRHFRNVAQIIFGRAHR